MQFIINNLIMGVGFIASGVGLLATAIVIPGDQFSIVIPSAICLGLGATMLVFSFVDNG